MIKKCIDAGIMISIEKGTKNAMELINIYLKKINNYSQHRV